MTPLTTERLLLRDARQGDELALASYHADPRYLAHYRRAPDTQAIVNKAIAWAREVPRQNYQLMIEFRETQNVIGCIGLRQTGIRVGTAEVGIELSPQYWGMGLASEAASEIMRFASMTLGLEALVSKTSPSNLPAHALLGSLGFVPGVTRSGAWVFETQLESAGR